MTDRAYIISRTLENKIAIAENNDQNTMLVTLDVLKEILAILREQEHKDRMFHALEDGWKRSTVRCGPYGDSLIKGFIRVHKGAKG